MAKTQILISLGTCSYSSLFKNSYQGVLSCLGRIARSQLGSSPFPLPCPSFNPRAKPVNFTVNSILYLNVSLHLHCSHSSLTHHHFCMDYFKNLLNVLVFCLFVFLFFFLLSSLLIYFPHWSQVMLFKKANQR